MEKGTVQMKYCKHCGARIPVQAVICRECGGQIEELKSKSEQPNIVINNSNASTNVNRNTNINRVGGRAYGRLRNKWVAFWLCVFLGYLGAHKFYEGKSGMGLLYIFTFGLFGFGWLFDCIALFLKPNPYYV